MKQTLLHLEHILFFFYGIYFQRYNQKTIGILILVDEHNQARIHLLVDSINAVAIIISNIDTFSGFITLMPTRKFTLIGP